MLENQIMIRAGMKRHKGSYIGIGILLLLTALSLTTVLMIALVGNSYIREEMERAGFGDLPHGHRMCRIWNSCWKVSGNRKG